METGIFCNEDRLERLALTASYNAEKLAELISLSPRHFRRLFQARFGCSPRKWLDDLKLIRAQGRLLAGHQVKQIAFELGYKDPSAFSHWFESVTGVWPSEFVSAERAGVNGDARMSDFRIRSSLKVSLARSESIPVNIARR